MSTRQNEKQVNNLTITSRKNAVVTEYRELLNERKVREQAGRFVIEGAKMIEEAARAGCTFYSVLFTAQAEEKFLGKLAPLLKNVETTLIGEDISAYISDTKTPQGIFAEIKTLDKPDFSDKIKKGSRLMILDSLQDIGNIGTIIRTCDAFGLDALILSKDCADIYSPKLVRATMGSLFRLPCIKSELTEIIPTLKEYDYTVYGAILDKTAEKLGSFGFDRKSAIVIGNEGNGISPQIKELCDKKVFIPMNNAESLNAAVAAGILAYSAADERKQNID